MLCQDMLTGHLFPKIIEKTLKEISKDDFVYCDPPYVGRHVDYFDSWDEENEQTPIRDSESIFLHNSFYPLGIAIKHRENVFLKTLWSEFNMLTKEHFYYLGAKEENRKPMLEALVIEFHT